MGKKNLHILLLIIACCVFLPIGVKAQSTYGYSSINYDPDTNTITAYSETTPDYGTQTYYYNAYVGSNIKDANGNVLASQSGLGNVSFSISGNGSSSYSINSGHYMLLSYTQTNVYSQCRNQYYSYAWYDYYNYQNFTESPSPDATFSLYLFSGPGPVCYDPSPDIILGTSTDSDSATQVSAPHPVNFHETKHADIGNGTLHFEYAWGSSTGNPADLSNCTINEVVTHSPKDLPYPLPFPAGINPPNPSVLPVPPIPGTDGVAQDNYATPGTFQKPYFSKTIIATQIYQYTCSGVNGGNPVKIMGPLQIKRTVSQNPNGSWKFTVTRSGGASATINPLF